MLCDWLPTASDSNCKALHFCIYRWESKCLLRSPLKILCKKYAHEWHITVLWCFFINSSFHHQGWTNVSSVLGVRTPFHRPSKANKTSRPPGRHMPALDFIWRTAIGCWIIGEICHEVNKLSFCVADVNNGLHPVPCWVHRAPYWSHGALLGLSITLDLSHSLQQKEEQNLLQLQPNSCFHGRAGLHVSPVFTCMLKRVANYIATA